MKTSIRTRTVSRLAVLALTMSFAAFLYNPSAGSAAATPTPALGSASGFAALAGTAVTCTNSTVTGNVGVWPSSAVTQTGCPVTGTIQAGNAVAKQAYLDFITAYNNLAPLNNACDTAHTLTGTLNAQILSPGVYCVDAVAKTGTLTLNAANNPNAFWIFMVNGALTGTNFNVVMLNGGQPCNVVWWVKDAATLTASNFLGTILAGAAITVTGGTFHGDALATAAVTLTTDASVTACQATSGNGNGNGNGKGDDKDKDKDHDKCNQGVGNGPENCDPGNSDHHNESNDERGGTPGQPGRKH